MKKLVLFLGIFLVLFLVWMSGGRGDADFVPRVKKVITQEIGTRVARRFKLKYLISDDKLYGLSPSSWAYSFLSFEQLRPEEGDKLIREVHRALFEELSSDPEVRLFFERRKACFDKECIALKISFWTPNYDRLKPPFVAQLSEVQDCYFYYYSKEDGSLGVRNRFTD